MKITKRLLLVLISSLSLAGLACKDEKLPPKMATPVQVQEAGNFLPGGAGSSDEGERYSASILPASQLELGFRTGGLIAAVHRSGGREVQEGDRVGRGIVLARLRDDDFALKVSQAESLLREARSAVEAHRAQLAEAESALRQAGRDLERATKLFESRSLTRPELDGARTKSEMAQARVEAVRAQGAVIEAKIAGAQALVDEAKLAQQDAVLRAPFDCYILKRMADVGGLAAPGRPVFVIAGQGSARALFGVPDIAVQRIRPGQSLSLTTEALPGTPLNGVVSRIAPAADLKTRTFDVEVTIARPPLGLKPGMVASLALPASGKPVEILGVPINAVVRLRQNPQRYAVLVVIADQTGRTIARQREVVIGEAYGGMIAIKDGVTAGDKVITSGAALIEDGAEVTILR
jgi:multidrug efflux pump subunit AcrA (membrane-fusion protein)